MTLKAPFPYFGGKSRVSSIVWERFGSPRNYVEPFFGSGAVLLARPDWQGTVETVNDKDCYLSNFWRAVQSDAQAVAHYADWPVNECDLHARHNWLVNSESARVFQEQMKSDPEYFDAKIASWWVWGISQWIGSGWCSRPEWSGRSNAGRAAKGIHSSEWQQRPALSDEGRGVHRLSLGQKRPVLGRSGRGVQRAEIVGAPEGVPVCRPLLSHAGARVHSHRVSQKMPLLANSGVGVHSKLPQQIPHLNGNSGAAGAGIHASAFDKKTGGIYEYFDMLCERLRRVRVCCGDWSRVMGPAVTTCIGETAVFLDPPYSLSERAMVYSHESNCAVDVLEWCKANGDNKLLKIALCGYEGEHDELEKLGWSVVAWKAPGGYAMVANGRGKANAHRERIWFSPHCINPDPAQKKLF